MWNHFNAHLHPRLLTYRLNRTGLLCIPAIQMLLLGVVALPHVLPAVSSKSSRELCSNGELRSLVRTAPRILAVGYEVTGLNFYLHRTIEDIGHLTPETSLIPGTLIFIHKRQLDMEIVRSSNLELVAQDDDTKVFQVPY